MNVDMAKSVIPLVGVLIAGLLIGYGVSIFQGFSSPLSEPAPQGPEDTVTVTGSVRVGRGEYIPIRVDFHSSNISSSALVTNVGGAGAPLEPRLGRYFIFLPSDRIGSYEITIAFEGSSKLLETCDAGFVYLRVDMSTTELNLIC